jgi:hypothetical protein
VVKLVRDQIGPVAAFKTVMVVKRLPKTRSGKILRGTMQKIADGEAWKMPATIDDPAILDEISEVLAKRGIKARAIDLACRPSSMSRRFAEARPWKTVWFSDRTAGGTMTVWAKSEPASQWKHCAPLF